MRCGSSFRSCRTLACASPSGTWANHTSGIRDQWDPCGGWRGWRILTRPITDDDVLQLLSRQRDLNFTPGERHLYSNSGYTLMAIIVSRAR